MSSDANPTHESIFGRSRYVLFAFLGVMASGAWLNQCGTLSGTMGGIGTALIIGLSFLGAWLATSDGFFRFALWATGAVPATYGAYRIGLLVGETVSSDSGALSIYAGIFAFVFLIVSGRWLYRGISSSRFIGHRCPRCKRRGKVESTEIGRSYSGMTHIGNTLYRQYSVTYRNSCGYCGGTWQVSDTESSPV